MARVLLKKNFYKTNVQPLITGENYLDLYYNNETSSTELVETQSINGILTNVPLNVWNNGVWNYIPGSVTTKDEKEKVQKLVKEYIKNTIAKDPRNKLPAFYTQNAPSSDQGTTSTPTPSETSFSFGVAEFINVVSGKIDINLDDYGSSKLEELFKSPLIYPKDIIDNRQDILKITQYKYQAPYRDIFEGTADFKSLVQNGAQRQTALKKMIQHVILPVPNNAQDLNSVSWSDDTVNTLSMGMAGKSRDVINALAAGKISDIASNFVINPGLSELLKILGQGVSANVGLLASNQALNNPTTMAAFRSEILRRALFDISPETILSRGYGVVANSNLELLFSGPTLRSFQFGYVLSPRSELEAETCKKIIRFFKQGMAAKKSNKTSGFGASSFLLATPNVFKLEYKTVGSNGKQKDIAGMNKFKICALKSFQVSYTDGQWSAFDEGQPVRYQIAFTFSELEPIYESDYQNKNSASYKSNLEDQPAVEDNEIGF